MTRLASTSSAGSVVGSAPNTARSTGIDSGSAAGIVVGDGVAGGRVDYTALSTQSPSATPTRPREAVTPESAGSDRSQQQQGDVIMGGITVSNYNNPTNRGHSAPMHGHRSSKNSATAPYSHGSGQQEQQPSHRDHQQQGLRESRSAPHNVHTSTDSLTLSPGNPNIAAHVPTLPLASTVNMNMGAEAGNNRQINNNSNNNIGAFIYEDKDTNGYDFDYDTPREVREAVSKHSINNYGRQQGMDTQQMQWQQGRGGIPRGNSAPAMKSKRINDYNSQPQYQQQPQQHTQRTQEVENAAGIEYDEQRISATLMKVQDALTRRSSQQSPSRGGGTPQQQQPYQQQPYQQQPYQPQHERFEDPYMSPPRARGSGSHAGTSSGSGGGGPSGGSGGGFGSKIRASIENTRDLMLPFSPERQHNQSMRSNGSGGSSNNQRTLPPPALGTDTATGTDNWMMDPFSQYNPHSNVQSTPQFDNNNASYISTPKSNLLNLALQRPGGGSGDDRLSQPASPQQQHHNQRAREQQQYMASSLDDINELMQFSQQGQGVVHFNSQDTTPGSHSHGGLKKVSPTSAGNSNSRPTTSKAKRSPIANPNPNPDEYQYKNHYEDDNYIAGTGYDHETNVKYMQNKSKSSHELLNCSVASATYVPPGLVMNSNENRYHNKSLANSDNRPHSTNRLSYM